MAPSVKEILSKEEIEFRVSLLKEVIIFTHIDDHTLDAIAQVLNVVDIKKEEELFHKGDLSQSMYIIKEGAVRVHDEDYVFTTLGSHQIFGEYALLDEMERSASVTAEKKTILFQLNKEDFDQIIKQEPEIKDGILQMLLLRLRERNDWEERLAQRNKKIERQKWEIEKKNLELTKLNKEIRAQRDEIQAQKDLKDRFFSIISHDLRGPVSSFQGISAIIRMLIKKERYHDLLEMSDDIDHSANQLSRLLDNLLNWASQQQSQIPYHPEEIDLVQMINNLFEVFKSTAVSKKIFLINHIKDNSFIWADRNTANTIFRNLINNALKFTEERGSITFTNVIDGKMMDISVADTGIGIPPEKLEDIFVLKDKKSTYGTKGEKGVGLGLQLVHEFARLNKGDVNVKSEEGKGTTFVVSLPINK